MVLFKYIGGGQIESPPMCSSDLTLESKPKTGTILSILCHALRAVSGVCLL